MSYYLPKIALITLLISYSFIQAQDTKILTLSQAIDLGLKESYSLKISSTKKNISDAKMNQGLNTLIPILSYYGNYTHLSNNITPFKIAFPGGGEKALNPQILDQYTNRVSLQETVFSGMRGNYALKALILQAAATDYDYRKDVADTRLGIVNQYLALYKFYQSKKILEENIKLASQRETDITNMQANGMALENDIFKAKLAKSNFEVAMAEVESAISNTNYNLNLMLGFPEETVIFTDETSAISTPDTAGLFNELFQAHTIRDEIKAQEIRTKSLNYQVKSMKGNYSPTLSVGANYYLNNPNQRIFPVENKFKSTWDFGANISWNFTQLYTNIATVKEAKANLDQAEMLKKQIENNIKMESRQSMNACKLAMKKIDLAIFAVKQASENQRVMQSRFLNNAALATDLLDADNALAQAKINLLSAKADASSAYYKALRVVGK